MASSSSSLYKLFCSVHESDVPKTVLSYIRKQLKSKGITMFYNEGIESKEKIAPSLMKAIRESRLSIVILSEKYASSGWCLDELVEIMECYENMGQKVMTIFHGVDSGDVGKRMGNFWIAFDKTCARKKDEENFGLHSIKLVEKWNKALKQVSKIAGKHSSKWVDEADMIEEIEKDALDQLNETQSRDLDDMVGLEGHLKKMQSLLDLDDNEVKMVAMTGPVGIGKTTIARALYARLSNRFQRGFFVDNLRGIYHNEFDEYAYKLDLQQQFLSGILNESGERVHHLGAIKEKLKDKKVLLILDDVDNLEQMEALAKETTWFGPGSRVVVISENKELLRIHGIDNIYHVAFPSNEDAFSKTSPWHGFRYLAESITRLCGNLPLGLSVGGSTLCGKKNEDQWRALKDTGNNDILRDIERQQPHQGPTPPRTKDIIEVSLGITNFILEIPSCVLDQMSSTHRPRYALAAMLVSILACLICLIDLLYKGITANVVWKWTWPFPWFYHTTKKTNPTEISKRFGSFENMVGLLCGVCQTILTAINFSFINREVDAPIKVSVWPIIFALGGLISMYLRKEQN